MSMSRLGLIKETKPLRECIVLKARLIAATIIPDSELFFCSSLFYHLHHSHHSLGGASALPLSCCLLTSGIKRTPQGDKLPEDLWGFDNLNLLQVRPESKHVRNQNLHESSAVSPNHQCINCHGGRCGVQDRKRGATRLSSFH